MKSVRITAALLAAASLSGCLATFDGQLQNRVTTTLDCKRGFVASLWGPIGFTSEIHGADVDQMPCSARDKAKAAPVATAPAVPPTGTASAAK
jgi:hypothetical protein